MEDKGKNELKARLRILEREFDRRYGMGGWNKDTLVRDGKVVEMNKRRRSELDKMHQGRKGQLRLKKFQEELEYFFLAEGMEYVDKKGILTYEELETCIKALQGDDALEILPEFEKWLQSQVEILYDLTKSGCERNATLIWSMVGGWFS
jgi:hypothetical protein